MFLFQKDFRALPALQAETALRKHSAAAEEMFPKRRCRRDLAEEDIAEETHPQNHQRRAVAEEDVAKETHRRKTFLRDATEETSLQIAI
jgi:hypothetical protein